jgi:hypothetical protein
MGAASRSDWEISSRFVPALQRLAPRRRLLWSRYSEAKGQERSRGNCRRPPDETLVFC